jgi:DNA primase
MLLLSSAWWEHLSQEDHQLLHDLPGAHGELIAWLERYLARHGASPWVVLEAALAEDGLLELAQRLSGGMYAEDEPLLEVFETVIKQLWIAQLKDEASRLAQSNPDAAAMARYKQLQPLIRALDLALKTARLPT